MLGPSGTGKTVFLKSIIGLLKPEQGRVLIDGVDMVNSRERDIVRGPQAVRPDVPGRRPLRLDVSLFDNIAFPLREHTRKKESEIRRIVMERIDMVGLRAPRRSCPARYPAACASAPAWPARWCSTRRSSCATSRTPASTRCAPPTSRSCSSTSTPQIDATMLIVTHNLDIAATVPDNMGMLFRRNLVTFGPREVLLTSEEPVVAQFLAGRRAGPIGMSEEKDEATLAARGRRNGSSTARPAARTVVPQLEPTPGLPERQAVRCAAGSGCCPDGPAAGLPPARPS